MMDDKKKSNIKKDVNELAFDIVQQATGEVQPETPPEDPTKNPHAVALGRCTIELLKT